ncbi:AI-2E family transporter [Stutzerimonas tarimensis]|uniref:AI-2E family transporter n=1 Tax=Stutzerimonas tarimensis TaxID=1507735 RepID=A0ABV7T2Y6_9GAMM
MAGPQSNKGAAVRALSQTAVVAAVVVFCLFVWVAFDFLLILFASILFGVFFHGVSGWVSEKTPIPRKLALAGFIVILVAIGGLFGMLVAPGISDQIDALSRTLPEAVERLRDRLDDSEWFNRLMEHRDRLEDAMPDGGVGLGVVASVTASIIGALTGFFIALVVGICLAISPGLYQGGFLRLVPLSYRDRAREVMNETGGTLKSWLIAKLFEMILIGVLTTLGLWLLGIELALVLGLIAGLLSFIPNIGPVIAVIPALLLASLEGGRTMLYVAGLYLLVQSIESYGLTPWLQKRIVSVPPAITVIVQLLFGLFAGTLGLLLATPLAAVAMVMTRMLYVEDVLGDHGEGER